MTRSASARLAGFMFLFYIATAFPEIVIYGRATNGASASEKLANIAQHASQMRLAAVLSFVTFVDAIVLAVALYAITRDQDRELALIALSCRLGEGVLNAISAVVKLGLLSVATAGTADAAGTGALGAYLLKTLNLGTLVSSTCFAAGSTVFAYLFLRARTIPMWLAWTGTLGSALLVAGLLLQMGDLLRRPATDLMWLPVAVFEIVLGFLLLLRGIRPSSGEARLQD